MLKIRQFVCNFFSESTFIAYDSDSLEAIVIDPGMLDRSERDFFDKFIAENNLRLTQIVNTHLHLDHCFGNNYVRDRYGVKIAASPADAFLGATFEEQVRKYIGDDEFDSRKIEIDIPLHEGDIIPVGQYKFHVIEVPGHSPGGIALYCPEYNCAFVGDSVFYGSVGRTDLPGGDGRTLIDSVRSKILTLPDKTQLFPGHDRMTTVGHEKASNPYLK